MILQAILTLHAFKNFDAHCCCCFWTHKPTNNILLCI